MREAVDRATVAIPQMDRFLQEANYVAGMTVVGLVALLVGVLLLVVPGPMKMSFLFWLDGKSRPFQLLVAGLATQHQPVFGQLSHVNQRFVAAAVQEEVAVLLSSFVQQLTFQQISHLASMAMGHQHRHRLRTGKVNKHVLLRRKTSVLRHLALQVSCHPLLLRLHHHHHLLLLRGMDGSLVLASSS